MKFKHLPRDPNAEGIGRIAEIYVTENIDMRIAYKPSATVVSLVQSEEVSDEFRAIFDKIISAADLVA